MLQLILLVPSADYNRKSTLLSVRHINAILRSHARKNTYQ